MAYELQDLYPQKYVLKLGNSDFELSLITLKKEVWFKYHYGSIQDAIDSLNKDPLQIFKLIWELLEDKSLFKDIETFKKYCMQVKNKDELGFKMSEGFNHSIAQSMPLIKNVKRYKDIQEIKGAADSNKPCYVKYFDRLSNRYGWSLDKFMELTLRQLHMMLKAVNDGEYEDLTVQAALVGAKLQPRMEFEDITEEEEAQQDADALAALKRLQEDYKKRQGSK